jgi:hypothetical protein
MSPDLTPDTETTLTFVNNTDSLICYFPNSAEAAAGEFCGEVKPRKQTVSRAICASGRKIDTAATTVVLTVGVQGREIYNRTATCKQWSDSHAKFIIDQREGEFVVTDSLPQTTPSSSQ